MRPWIRRHARKWSTRRTQYPGLLFSGVPSMGALVRSRSAEIHRESPRLLHTAFSLGSVLDEAIYVVDPALAITLSTSVSP
ncbi:hypothetical protein QF037_001798 [Streptomyces canus]|nr:hypothetical protein [Streptomyces canus]